MNPFFWLYEKGVYLLWIIWIFLIPSDLVFQISSLATFMLIIIKLMEIKDVVERGKAE